MDANGCHGAYLYVRMIYMDIRKSNQPPCLAPLEVPSIYLLNV